MIVLPTASMAPPTEPRPRPAPRPEQLDAVRRECRRDLRECTIGELDAEARRELNFANGRMCHTLPPALATLTPVELFGMGDDRRVSHPHLFLPARVARGG